MKSNFCEGGSDAMGPVESNYPECGRLCGTDQMTHLMMCWGIVEGDLLNYVAAHPSISLNQLIRSLEWQPCLITMAVGLFIREELVSATILTLVIIPVIYAI